MKNLFHVLGFLACMLIAVGTATGHVQSVISFEGAANEMAFCLLSFMGAAGFMFSALSKDIKAEKRHGFE
jgi:hypothetical protein